MANVCSKCSTENADGALACRHCGAALATPAGWSRSLIPEDDTFDPLSAPTLVMQHTAPAQLPEVEAMQPLPPAGSTGRRLVWGLASFVVLLAAGVWLLRPGSEPAVVAATAPASATALATSGSTTEPPVAAASAASVASLAVPTAQTPAAPASPPSAPPASEPASAVLPAAAPATAAERRKRIPEPVIRRPVPAPVPAAPASEPAPAPAPAPASPASAAEPPRVRTVAELCAGNSLLTRGFCEHRECGKAEHAGDPVCVRIQETEQARRLRQ